MTTERALELLPQMRDSEWITAVGQVTAIYTDEAKEAFNMAISALKKQEQTIEFIESRKQLHSSPVWYEFGIVKELDEVKRFVEKMQAEEEA